MWQDQTDMQSDRTKAIILAIVFVFCSINLFTAIVLTITTSPGYIPEHTEWDMPAESDELEEEESLDEEGMLKNAAQDINDLDLKISGDDEPRDSNLSGILASHNKHVDKQLKTKSNRQEDFINQEIIED